MEGNAFIFTELGNWNRHPVSAREFFFRWNLEMFAQSFHNGPKGVSKKDRRHLDGGYMFSKT